MGTLERRAIRSPRGLPAMCEGSRLVAALLFAFCLLLALLFGGILLLFLLRHVLSEHDSHRGECQRKPEHQAHQFLHCVFSCVTNCVVWVKDNRRDMNGPLTGN